MEGHRHATMLEGFVAVARDGPKTEDQLRTK